MPKTVKLSYSILNAWANGYEDDAVSYYLGKDVPPTPEMELGRAKHEAWEKFIKEHGATPPELGGIKLTAPIVEQKYEKVIPFNEDYQILLRGKLDTEDGETIFDWKCGKGRPGSYLSSMQMPYYKLLRPKTRVAVYVCHNPYHCEDVCKKEGTFQEEVAPDGSGGDLITQHTCFRSGLRYLEESDAKNALEHIITFGGEIIQALEMQGLVRDYKGVAV